MDGYQALTPEFFQEIVSSSDPGVNISTVQVSTGSGRGDNYTSMLYRVRAEGCCSEERPWSKSFICKILPVNRARREAFKSDTLFQNEVAFYTRALPALQNFQTSKKISVFRETPKVYLAKSHIIVLEDLKERGFIMADRKKALDLPHCEAILTTLGHLHGLSMALKVSHPKTFSNEVTDQVSECLFKEDNIDWYTQYYRQAGLNASHILREQLEGQHDAEKYYKRFENFMDAGFFQRMINDIQPVESVAVLCHGDCWTNNFLFQYTDTGAITDLCMVDFQFARYGSPALDLVYLLFNCTTSSLRTAHLNSLLITYTNALKQTLTSLGCSIDAFGNEDIISIIEREIRRCSRIGLGLAIEMIPICTCDSEQAPDLYLNEQSTSNSAEDQEINSSNRNAVSSTEACRTRITDLVVELVDAEII